MTNKSDILEFAIKNNHLDILKYIIDSKTINPKSVDFIYLDFNDVIRLASKYGQLNIVQYFVSLGKISDGKHSKCSCNQSMILASKNSHLDIVKYFVTIGANINYDDSAAYRIAAKRGYFNIVEYFISQGINVNVRNDFAVRHAAKHGHLSIVKYLIKYGANIRALDDFAYKMAKKLNHQDVIDYLDTIIDNSNTITEILGFSCYSPRPITSKQLQKFHRDSQTIETKTKISNGLVRVRELLAEYHSDIKYNEH
ncbi:hypothetical protein QJ850_gp919 [Acanthamoeba polyphaga mimivirus]|uniref:Uncharacterized protein n=1 Tax=Acanthamoeba polyphaga mimivirus Kroon TaxID=3069720 RepID=A0A0G2Y222_9VIRU|nr:hypothetical protein QJ850_gp919 [Acanthamoeba polyphaga mimivirus]AKI79780.1 hypothetical protein [Acanthamoeba polyphaga mimivirus Kroon]